MRVLLTGANGFIGAHIGAALVAAGHSVLGCARDVVRAKRQFPALDWIACDFNADTTVDDWTPRLDGVDAVVNCAGILQGGRGDTLDAVHRVAPVALFDACAAAGVRRVVQISAIGADPGAGTEYADSKRAADDHLAGLDLDWVILRPSLVYARGSYGGTSLLRGLAALPFRIPLAGGGRQTFQPTHVEDLAEGAARLVEPESPARILLHPCGPETLTVRQIVRRLRCWLGIRAIRVWAVPMTWVRGLARIGDLARRLGAPVTLTTTAVRQMEYSALADPRPFIEATGVRPRSFATGLAGMPSSVQDRWHARLYFVRPALRISLALVLIFMGLQALYEMSALIPGWRAEWVSTPDLWTWKNGLLLVVSWLLRFGFLVVGAYLLIGRRVRQLAFAAAAIMAFMFLFSLFSFASSLTLIADVQHQGAPLFGVLLALGPSLQFVALSLMALVVAATADER